MGIISTDAYKPLPAFLENHKNDIRNIFQVKIDKPREWKYNSELWRSFFQDDPVLSNYLNEVMKECPESITRQQVQTYAYKLLTGTIVNPKNLFIACMLWGYGPDPNGPKNTKLALNDSKIDNVLHRSVGLLLCSKIKEAYEKFNIKGCGPAYFTKFFYFVGKVHNLKPLPLISDSHVANYLEYLSETKRISDLNFFQVINSKKQGKISRISKYTSGYIDYIQTLDKWADDIGCPADNIEYFLYLSDKKRPNNKSSRNKKGENMNKITKVGHKNTKWLKETKAYCANKGLSKEWSMIEDMPKPQNWNLERGGSKSSGRPEWWFRQAFQGIFIQLCQYKKITEWPPSKNGEDTLIKAAEEYLTTTEGMTWQKIHTPYWLKKATFDTPQPQIAPPTQSSGNITVTLSPIQINQVKKLAEEWEVEEQVAAKILIILGLNKIGGNN